MLEVSEVVHFWLMQKCSSAVQVVAIGMKSWRRSYKEKMKDSKGYEVLKKLWWIPIYIEVC